jgi:hypothetical protein
MRFRLHTMLLGQAVGSPVLACQHIPNYEYCRLGPPLPAGYNRVNHPSMKSSATAESLMPYLRSFVGISKTNLAFKLLCSTNGCYREDEISASRHALKSERHKLKAAERLVQQGWTCPEQPLCPDCSRSDE